MRNYFKFIYILLFIFTVSSCDIVEDSDVGGTSTEKLAGDWYIVGLESDGVTAAYGGDYVEFMSYNTSANNGEMWIDDFQSFFEIKARVITNSDNLTFSSGTDIINLYGGTAKILNGKITKEGFTVASGTKVDAIYFEVEFDWDPGYIYKFQGHKRTGFAEDQDPHYSH